ncbi:hypothetical protein [Alkalihalobacillus sp. AL-G]|uniref:hypothetical protein n=1 Tax=Alkalihalobacillus sp. AL-G TaxID=2926399 RepID=UPI00272CB1CD|nr:hypothetical protein [Alkalihalobacillus sp. AL-G]WLD92330.1 hypothetical protein MOJ78_15080 [Alkalihalobacillus sp. AL-G]
MKQFLFNLVYTFVMILLVIEGYEFQRKLVHEGSAMFNMYPSLLFLSVYPIVLGMLFRLPLLFKEVKDGNKWKVGWVKIISIGLPAFYIASFPALYFSPITDIVNLYPMNLNLDEGPIISIAGVVFGYVLLDSIKE